MNKLIPIIVLFSFNLFGQVSYCTTNKKAIELYVEADNYRVRRQFRQAEDLLIQALKKDKNFCEAFYRLALVYHDMKDGKRAIETFTKGLDITTDPRKRKVFYFDLAEEHLLLGDYEKAKDFATQFLAEEKSHAAKIERAKFWVSTCEYAIQNNKSASPRSRPGRR
jgi:tetratricopeptide (TPR) repeat protein